MSLSANKKTLIKLESNFRQKWKFFVTLFFSLFSRVFLCKEMEHERLALSGFTSNRFTGKILSGDYSLMFRLRSIDVQYQLRNNNIDHHETEFR